MKVTIDIPEEVLEALPTEFSGQSRFLLKQLAFSLFVGGIISPAKAADMCGLGVWEFLQEASGRLVSATPNESSLRHPLRREPRQFGCAPGLVRSMADEFNETVDDFGDFWGQPGHLVLH